MLTWLFVAARIVANPVSNVFQKRLAQRSAHPIFVIAVTHALLTLVCLPMLPSPLKLGGGADFWANIMAAAFLAVAGNALLVAALRTSDLSVLGPINAYKSVISLVLGIFLVHEIPTPTGVMGVLLIVAGSYFVVDRDENQPRRNAFILFFQELGVQLRIAALGLSATEAIFLKRALIVSTPLTTFVVWCVLGLPIAALAAGLLLRGRLRRGNDNFVSELGDILVARGHHRAHAIRDTLHVWKTSGGLLARSISIIHAAQRFPRLSVFSGAEHPKAAARHARYDRGGSADYRVRIQPVDAVALPTNQGPVLAAAVATGPH